LRPSQALREWFDTNRNDGRSFNGGTGRSYRRRKNLLAELKRAEKMHGKLTLLFGAGDQEHNQAVVLLPMLKNKK
jgi:uncharacterized protein YeaO (DUF488 family)